jgi:hypothetical protein
MDDRGSIPGRSSDGILLIHHRIHTGPGNHTVKRPVCEANHSPSSSTEVKNAWSYNSTAQYVFMVSCLTKQNIRLHDMMLN